MGLVLIQEVGVEKLIERVRVTLLFLLHPDRLDDALGHALGKLLLPHPAVDLKELWDALSKAEALVELAFGPFVFSFDQGVG